MRASERVVTGARAADESGDLVGLGFRQSGLTMAAIGWMAAMLALVIGIVTGLTVASGGTPQRVAALDVLSFGIAIAALGTGKTGIALVLRGIVRRIGQRVASIRAALPALVPAADGRGQGPEGLIDTAQGKARITKTAPQPLFVHDMARVLWLPMLVMGLFALYFGLLVSLEAAGKSDEDIVRSLKAWVQGLQFLGEGFLLSAVSLILGTILAAIRSGGGEVQQSLGAAVKTLLMPLTAKIFLGLMMVGLMIEIVQFLFYIYVSSLRDVAAIATFSAWLGPFREFGLGVLLSGVVLALATIARALDFQFSRIRELIATGR